MLQSRILRILRTVFRMRMEIQDADLPVLETGRRIISLVPPTARPGIAASSR